LPFKLQVVGSIPTGRTDPLVSWGNGSPLDFHSSSSGSNPGGTTFNYNCRVKVCYRCKAEKPLDEFNKNSGKPDGLQSCCRTCTKEVNNDLYRNGDRAARVREAALRNYQRNVEHVRKYLATHPCVDCGEADIIVLDFDHVRGVKLMNVSEMVRGCFSVKKIQAEIDKCEVRCANDHRRITARRRLEQARLV
jgi:hypothetical protein